MAEKKKYYNILQSIQELKESEGLPQSISTEAQLWDEIFKKEAYLMQDQFFPLIQEIHKKVYPKDVSVRPLATEYPVERRKTKEIASIRSDITICVGGCDIYHFECEIGNDRTMVLRMFEYDTHIALEYHRLDMENAMVLPFPYSAVLYLQDNKNIPDQLFCKIQFPDGITYEHVVSAVRVQSYSLEEIQQKHLSVLIPFLPLQFRKRLPQVEKEELTSFYQNIILILNKEVAEGYLNEGSCKVILSLLRKAMVRVFYKDETLLEEVMKMTEPILELEFEQMERLAGEMAEQIARKMAGPMAEQMAGEMAEQMAGPMAEQMAGEMAEQMAGPIAEQMAGPMAEQMADSMAEQMMKQRTVQMEQKYKKYMEELTFQKEKELMQKEEEIIALKKQLQVLQNSGKV